MKQFLIAVFVLLPLLAQAQVDDADEVNWDSPATVQNAVDQFWAEWSNPSTVTYPLVPTAIADPISFYGKPLSRDAYMKAQQLFDKRWPERQFTVQPGSENIACSKGSSLCQVTGIIDWKYLSLERDAASSGSEKFSFLLQEKPVGAAILYTLAAETGSVINRTSSNAAAGSMDLYADEVGCVTDNGTGITHQDCALVTKLSLSGPFHTKENSVFAVTQLTDTGPAGPAELSFCFLRNGIADCESDFLDSDDPGTGLNQFGGAVITYPTTDAYYPILFAEASLSGGFGCGGLANLIWAYDPVGDKFNRLWNRSFDCHDALRFETKGPLAGDMIVIDNTPTDRWPWLYGVEVFKFLPPDRYVRILDFLGRAGQGGKYASDPNGAIAIDMPEILHRLGDAN